MRSESQMYDLILGFAQSQENIRGVILNGSRANPECKKDPFCDFDIVYLTNDLTYYKNHPIHHEFGELLVYQRTDESELFAENYPDFVCYLMQFTDGNRIDLTIASVENYYGYCFDDHLSVVLLDKDGFLPELPPPDNQSHWIKKPTPVMFQDCRTEFWWVCPYVSKGLWRGQALFAQSHMEHCIRKMLLQMLEWYVGATCDFSVSGGKCGDLLQQYLPPDWWARYRSTYTGCTTDELWQALFTATELFTQVSRETAALLGYTIEDDYDRQVPRFLQYTKALPKDAKTLDFA